MNEAKEMFQQQTITALNRCADYLRDNAENIAKRFSDESHGCKEWSIEFHAGEDGHFTRLVVRESMRMSGMYLSSHEHLLSFCHKSPIASDDEKGKHRYTIQMREEITGCANCPMSYRDDYYFGAYGCGGRNDVNPCVLPVPTNDPPNCSGDFIPDWCPLEKANS